MILALILLLPVLVKKVSPCEDNLFILRDSSTTNNRLPFYERPFIYRNTQNSTIVCSDVSTNLTFLYRYNDKYYEQFLKIINSELPEFPSSALTNFQTITKLYLSALHIKVLVPGAFNGLIRLRELYLDGNKLESLDRGVYNSLHRLEILDLSGNKISQIEQYALMGLTNLMTFHMEENHVKEVNNSLVGLTHLKELYFSKNPIVALPTSIPLTVEILYMDQTHLENLDQNMSSMTIELFNVSSSRLKAVDLELLPKLNNLDLSNNTITSISNWHSLDCVFVNLASNEIQEIGEFSPDFSELNLTHNQLEFLNSSSFIYSKALIILDVSHNLISTIESGAFRGLSSLTTLKAANNKISQIDPTLLYDLQSLEVLDLSHNQLQSLHHSAFSTLSNLKFLSLSHNRVQQLQPVTLAFSLEKLYFDHNEVTSFNYKKMSNLKMVSLDGNKFACEDLRKIIHDLLNAEVDVEPGNSYNEENYNGISCNVGSKKSENQTLENTSLFQFLNGGFKNSSFYKFFSNFSSDGIMKKVEEPIQLASTQQGPEENSISMFAVTGLLIVYIVLALGYIYFIVNVARKVVPYYRANMTKSDEELHNSLLSENLEPEPNTTVVLTHNLSR